MEQGRIRALDARTVCEAFQVTAAERPEQVAHRNPEGSVEFTFGEYAARVRSLAAGLHSLGVRRGDTVAFMLQNRPEFALTDAAAMHLGAIGFSIYNTSSVEQIAYLLENSQSRVIVTETMMLPRILQARSATLEHIVLVDGTADGALTLDELGRRSSPGFDFDASWRAIKTDDVITLIYTSGTTGAPKAVQLTHGNVMFAARAYAEVMPVKPGGRGLSFLPTAHISDRVGGYYHGSLCYGYTMTSLTDYRQLGAVLPTVRPTVFGGVPRIFEKIKAAIEGAGLREPAKLPEPVRAAVRAKMGLDQVTYSVSGAAPASPEVLRFFADLGLTVHEAWGMSETTFIPIINPPGDVRIGTIGRPLPGVEVRTLEDGELLVRSPLVMKGYRNDPVRTAEALDADGWLHTGDIVQVDADGYITIVDRKKELIINSAGKNMSPANIEFRLRGASSLIAYAVCVGDRRPYNVALLVLDPEASGRWATERGLPTTPAELCRNAELRSVLQAAVDAANESLSRVEQIKKFAIVGSDWQPGGDELTPTTKLKRRTIHEKYAAVIDDLYG